MRPVDKFLPFSGDPSLAMELPLSELDNPWLYYTFCGLVFILAGVVCGYFIWRKGLMQTLDAEMEIEKTRQELQALREDVEKEEQNLKSGEKNSL